MTLAEKRRTRVSGGVAERPQNTGKKRRKAGMLDMPAFRSLVGLKAVGTFREVEEQAVSGAIAR
jgi:hypothetical protein